MVQGHKSQFRPKHPEKYTGRDPTKIISRSSWERKLMARFDIDPNILSWSSESVVVPYRCPVRGDIHRYFVDFWIKVKTKDGGTKEFLIEVKPSRQTRPPRTPKKKSRQHLQEVATYAINQKKWEAARQFAESRGWTFLILTERELNIPGVSG